MLEEKLIKNIRVFDPKEFEYGILVGEGAFGKVRKCYRTKVEKEVEEVKVMQSKNKLDMAMQVSSKIAIKKKPGKDVFAVKI